jgi:hypothetical protein
MTLTEPRYSISYYKTEQFVELTWPPGTQKMTDQDFKEVLEVFAEGVLQHRARRLLIDVRHFRRRPSGEVFAWRDEVTVPKYERAGVKRLAWVWPGADPGEMGRALATSSAIADRGTRQSRASWRASSAFEDGYPPFLRVSALSG